MDEWMDVSDHSYISRDGHHLYGLICSQSLGTPGSHQAHTHALSLSLSLDRQSGSPTGAVSSHPHMARYGSGASHPGRQTSRRISDVLHSFEKAIRPGAEAGGEAAIGHTGPGWRPLVGAEAMLASQGWRQAAGEAYVVYVCMCVVWTRASQAACSAQRPNGRPAFACACLLVRDSRLPYRTHSRALSLSLEYECIISCMSVASAVPRHARGERGTIPSHLTTNEGLHHSLLTTTRHSPLVQPEQRFPSPCHTHSCPDAGWAAWPDSHGAVEKGLVTASLVHWSGRVELVGRVVVSETGRA